MLSSSRRLGLRFVAACLFLSQIAAFAEDPALANGQLRIEFDPAHGGMSSLIDMHSNHNFIQAGEPGPLWTLDMLDTSVPPVTAHSARAFTWAPAEGGINLVWSDFGLERAPRLQVTVRVYLDATKPESRWRLRIEGLQGLPLRVAHFPRIERLARQEDEHLAIPVWMGQITGRARELLSSGGTARRQEWEYPGLLSMQILTAYGAQGGLYVSCTDTTAQRKLFAVFGYGRDSLGTELIHFPQPDSEVYETPYETSLGTFVGDWVTAAELYRTWALEQTWARQSRLRQDQTPPWVLDTGLWIWNRGRSKAVLAPAATLQEKARLPVSVFWHWWHGCPYDAGFPEYLPPREGEGPFQAALHEAHQHGVHALVYMNQRLWGMTTKSWIDEGAERYAVKGPDGTVHPEVYNTFMKAPCASMCMGTPFWRNKYAGLAEAAVGLGVDGIYMDQACSSLACYDPTHGHPPGGGSYWMEGFRQLEGDIRRRCAASGVTLAGEGCGEAWLPHLDLMLSLQVSMERYMHAGQWEPIPFFQSVYHDCAVFYGNYSSLTYPPYDDLWPAEFAPKEPLRLLDRKFSRQFRLEQARAFVWGQQPTLANFRPEHFESRPTEMAYALDLARLRAHSLKYLLRGTFLRPPEVSAPRETIPMSRLSIYAGQHDAVKEFEMLAPLALASTWRAPDGGVAFVVASIAEEPLELRLPLDRKTYGLPETGGIYTIEINGEKTLLRNYSRDDTTFSITLPPCSARVFEFHAD